METTSLPPPRASANPPIAQIIFGVVNILFGFIGLAGSLIALRIYFTPLEGQTGPIPELMRANSFYASSMRILAIPAILYGLAQFISGIGLVRSREWARKLALCAALYAIPVAAFTSFLNLQIIIPFTTEYTLRTLPTPTDPQFIPLMTTMMKASGMMNSTLFLLYPILLIIFLTRPKVRVHCKAVSSKPETLAA